MKAKVRYQLSFAGYKFQLNVVLIVVHLTYSIILILFIKDNILCNLVTYHKNSILGGFSVVFCFSTAGCELSTAGCLSCHYLVGC